MPFNEKHNVTSQKIELYITKAVRASDPTEWKNLGTKDETS
jgi:hypothetical protein